MLTITVLASGSRGNATLVESQDGAFLIDCGLSRPQILGRFAAANREPDELKGILITHLHGDHVAGGAFGLAEQLGIPIWIHEKNRPWLLDRFGRQAARLGAEQIRSFRFEPFALGGCTVSPFLVPHDIEANTCGLTVEGAEGGRFVYATDLGHFPERLDAAFAGCDVALLEFNHCPVRLGQSRRPQKTKQRIAGAAGHLSNQQAAEALGRILASGKAAPKVVLVAHMSDECNSERLVIEQLNRTLGADWPTGMRFVFAHQEEVADPVVAGELGRACVEGA